MKSGGIESLVQHSQKTSALRKRVDGYYIARDSNGTETGGQAETPPRCHRNVSKDKKTNDQIHLWSTTCRYAFLSLRIFTNK